MHKYLKTIVFIAGASAGIVALLGLQKLQSFQTIAALLDDQEASAVVRNYGLLAIGLVGIVTAMIRLSMADTQQRQDKRSDLFDRFQKSSEMLNSENMAVRQAGLYTLAEIAKEQPNEFYIMVQSLFCGFLRNASIEMREALSKEYDKARYTHRCEIIWPTTRADAQDAIDLFSNCRKVCRNARKLEEKAGFRPDLSGLFMPNTLLKKTDLHNCVLEYAVFEEAALEEVNLNRADLTGANFDRAFILNCRLESIDADRIELRWAIFFGGTISAQFVNDCGFEGVVAEKVEFKDGIFGRGSTHPVTGKINKFPHFTNQKDQIAAKGIIEERISRKAKDPLI